MPDQKEVLGRESLLAIKDYVDNKSKSVVDIVDLTDLDDAQYALILVDKGEIFIRINFSQGYVLGDVTLHDKVNDVDMYVEMDYNSGSYSIADEVACSVDGYNMRNKTTGGLKNNIDIEPQNTVSQASDLEIVDINFIKVEGTFLFEL